MKTSRRLAAIVVTDVVGYSRLMGADDEGTRAAMRKLQKELWDPKVEQFGGRIVKTTGDGQLLEFVSVVDALKYSVELQQGMAARNEELPERKRIDLRVGVNLGDVIVEGEDIHGDGVNVAARLEGLAEPGGICISRAAQEQVKGKLNLEFEDLGAQEVKNIADPVQIYRVDFGNYVPVVVASGAAARPDAKRRWLLPAVAAAVVVIAAAGGGLVWWQPWVTRVEAANAADMALPLPEKPSIAVLPFVNLSSDPGDALLPDGITEDITTALSRLPSFFVISRTTTSTYKGKPVTVKQVAEDLGVRYVLEGSVQRDGDQMRVTAQLIDALSGRHVWADRYDRPTKDLFAVQDEITLNIVSNIGAELQTGEADRILRRDTNSLDAWLLVREAAEEFDKLTPESLDLARTYVERAIAIDPGFISAHAFLAGIYAFEVEFGYAAPDEALDKAFGIATRALSMNPSNATALVGLGHIYRIRGDLDLAIDTMEKAVALEPSDFDARGSLAHTLVYTGRFKEAVQHARLAMRLSPVTPDWLHAVLGEAHLLSGELEESEATFKRLLGRELPAPLGSLALARLALVLAATGREQEAREAVQQAVELFPQTSISYEKAANPFQDASITEQRSEIWRRLGMPE